MRVERIVAAGSIVSGVLASACCIGPLVFALLGMSGAALAQRFEPWRPYLLILTYALLGTAAHLTWRRPACGPGGCEMPRTDRVGKTLLVLAALAVVAATTFPWYGAYLPF